MQVTSATSATGGLSSTDSLATGAQTLNQKDFLQLLVSQMENQDPMNPQSNTDMAAQMAQFTALTQASASSASLAMMQADSLLGRTVTLQVDSQTTATGAVQGVVLTDQAKSLDWRAREAELICRLPASSTTDVLQKLGALLQS